MLVLIFFLFRKRRDRIEAESLMKKFDQSEGIMDSWQKHNQISSAYHKIRFLEEGRFE
jgi:hypothetical protein